MIIASVHTKMDNKDYPHNITVDKQGWPRCCVYVAELENLISKFVGGKQIAYASPLDTS